MTLPPTPMTRHPLTGLHPHPPRPEPPRLFKHRNDIIPLDLKWGLMGEGTQDKERGGLVCFGARQTCLGLKWAELDQLHRTRQGEARDRQREESGFKEGRERLSHPFIPPSEDDKRGKDALCRRHKTEKNVEIKEVVRIYTIYSLIFLLAMLYSLFDGSFRSFSHNIPPAILSYLPSYKYPSAPQTGWQTIPPCSTKPADRRYYSLCSARMIIKIIKWTQLASTFELMSSRISES